MCLALGILERGITGTIDAWGTIQSLNLQACIVGKTVQMVVVIDIAGLLQGILLKGLSRFRYVNITVDILER